MSHSSKDRAGKSSHPRPIHAAKDKTAVVQDELKLAAAKLHLTNTALNHTLPAAEKKGDVKKALDENAAVEEQVKASARELAHVKDLLEEEEAERHRLEEELARKGG